MNDINLDGLVEIVAYFDGCLGWRCPSIEIYRWDGNSFTNLIENYQECGRVSYSPLDVKIQDIDQNGTMEIILHNDGKPWPDGLGFPYRGETHICMWNGKNISLYKAEYGSPYYRFQALQDGDASNLRGDYEKALISYQQTISDKELEWFNKERGVYDFWGYHASYFPSFAEPTPTASPSLQPDPSEYPRLAAYAYYRILLLHLVQGQDSETTTTYTTLQQTFGDDPYARPYLEMATAFWEAYQSTRKMYDACAAAIQYAAEHPEILTPLGSDYHGAQSHIYKPEDVCPFR